MPAVQVWVPEFRCPGIVGNRGERAGDQAEPWNLSAGHSKQIDELSAHWNTLSQTEEVKNNGEKTLNINLWSPHTYGHLHSHVHVHKPVLIHIPCAYHTHTHSRRNARHFFCIRNEMLKSVIFKLNFMQLPWMGPAHKRNWIDLFS